MAHICAVAGREPVKVSEDSGSETSITARSPCISYCDPLDMSSVPTLDGWTCAGRVQVFLTDRTSSHFGPLAEDEDANPKLVNANIR